MVHQITEGVSITVETYYQEEQSNPRRSEFLFAYRITIENLSASIVQLLSRHWYIVDSGGQNREVKGEGVIGQQPVIRPGNSYRYVSACNLNSDMGKMYGSYTMINQDNGRVFRVEIPEFDLIVPAKMN